MTTLSNIHKWKKNLGQLNVKALQNSHAKTCHKGSNVEEIEFEREVQQWILDQRAMDIGVRTTLASSLQVCYSRLMLE
jgi:hypothetical protein